MMAHGFKTGVGLGMGLRLNEKVGTYEMV